MILAEKFVTLSPWLPLAGEKWIESPSATTFNDSLHERFTMKLLLLAFLLSVQGAYAQCVFVPNSMHCVDKNQAYNDQQDRQRQQQQIDSMQKQMEQQRRLNELNSHNSQQPNGFRQQCYQNVFGIIECK